MMITIPARGNIPAFTNPTFKETQRMRSGDIVRNRNSESGEMGVFMGMTVFKNQTNNELYECAEVYWPERRKVGTIQTSLVEVISAGR